MTKVIMKEKTPIVHFEELSVGSCFFDQDNIFCIKVNSTSCLIVYEDLTSWEEYIDCCPSDEVFPVDVEIHIVN